MKINERWEALREESNANIQSEEGILKRQTRSIQTEGHFGDIKENENFRRFNYRSAEKVYKEFMLYAIGRNILKYHRFLHHENREIRREKGAESRLTDGAPPYNPEQGAFCALKYEGQKGRETIRQRIQILKKSEFSGIVSFLRVRGLKFGITR